MYSDTICPWCYIGFQKLKDAISDFSSDNFNLIWRPFQLNPDMPIEGMERKKYLELKFGGKNNYKSIYKNIYNVGLKNNIHFQFDKIAKTPNSFASHKLLALAHKSKKQTQIVETLFYNYFIEGVDIGDIKELLRIAKQHNIYQDDTYIYLQSKKDRANLLAEESHAKELGVTGVPCFIINKEFVLFGSQDKKNFLEIFHSINNVN
ncbi:DsbA family oxidoreductase [Alphaproteobacteria bacterium]|nr:DsbA family oxidoreductase [Alphaproteobacteria bacterium]